MSSDTAPGWIPGAGLTDGGFAKKPKRMLNWNTNIDVYRQCSFEILNGFFAKPLLQAGRFISTKFNLKTKWKLR
jgi:hypothetical protein